MDTVANIVPKLWVHL